MLHGSRAWLSVLVVPKASLANPKLDLILRLQEMVRSCQGPQFCHLPSKGQKRRATSLVACAVTAETPTHTASIFGVNFELHRRVNYSSQGTSASARLPVDGVEEDSSPLLRGVLKGCAEQNALGALAAQGVPYHCVSEVLLYSEPASGSTLAHDAHVANSNGCPNCKSTGPASSVLFPCPECWHHLSKVGEMVARRGGRPLRLVVATAMLSDCAQFDGLPQHMKRCLDQASAHTRQQLEVEVVSLR